MIIQMANEKIRISNDNEVARKLTVECVYENGKTDILIEIPPERYGCLTAMLYREEFFWFVKTHYADDVITEYTLLDDMERKILFGKERVKWKGIEDTNLLSLNLLRRMKKIEDSMKVGFYLPEEIYDYDEGRVEIIEEILKRGYTDRYTTNTGIKIKIDSRANLAKIRDYANRNNRFQMYYCGNYYLNIWGCKIKIGKVHFLSPVYKVVNKDDLKRKIKTFKTGDIRQVEFILENENKWSIIVDKYYQEAGEQLKKAPLLPLPSNIIPFDMFEEIEEK